MRTALPQLRTNGHAPAPGRVFAITGTCQRPRFLLRFRHADPADVCLIYLGAPSFGAPGRPEADAGGEPYFILRRAFDGGEAQVVLQVEWEGIFTLLANDDGCAESVYADLVEPGAPEEVQRQWTGENETLGLFEELLRLGQSE